MISKIVKQSEGNSEVVDGPAKKISKEVVLIAQQVKIARALASNDLRVRTKQLKKLKKWLNIRANSSFPFSDADFLRIWKGLFYCMWMSDKPLVQEDLAEDISSLLHCFSNPPVSAQFFGCFLKCMAMEWFGIDQWRMDKFLMLIRRMLRHMFMVLKEAKWKKKLIVAYNKQIKSLLLSEQDTTGVLMHVIDIYLEELAKIADGEISSGVVALFIKPFIKFIAKQSEHKMLAHVRKNIFYQLLWQSELGREFEEKFNAWKEMGFPTENIDDLEKVDGNDLEEQENEDEESEEATSEEEATNGQNSKNTPLDPRAGRVDIVVPEMPVDVDPIIRELEKLLYEDITNTKSRKVIREILDKCKTFRGGEFPLGVKTMPKPNLEPLENLIDSKVDELEQFEEQLLSTTRHLKKLNKKKRKKILQSIDFTRDDVNEENFEQLLAEAIPIKKRKISSERSMINGWQEEEVPASLLKDDMHNEIELKKKMEKKQKKVRASLLKNKETVRPKAKLNSKTNKKKQKLDKISNGASNGFTETSIEPQTSSISTQCLNKDISKSNMKKSRKLVQLSDSMSRKSSAEKISVEPIYENEPKLKHKDPKTKKVKRDITATRKQQSGWEVPLEDGEIEYFVPSRKAQLKKANQFLQQDTERLDAENKANLVLNPFAKNKIEKKSKNQLLGKGIKKAQSLKNMQDATAPLSSSGKKRVKIALQKNCVQKPSEYIKQVLSSPQVPFDATKKPVKGLLKPNLIPSPINPFYKKKIGLTINDSI